MINVAVPLVFAAILIGLGVFGVLVRRNAILMLVGIELVLAGGLLLLVTAGALLRDSWAGSSVLPLFVITIAAAEVVVALSTVLLVFRQRATVDLDSGTPVEIEDLSTSIPGGVA